MKTKKFYFLTAFLIIVMMIIQYLMGRVPICDCGYIKLWHGNNWSSENSQHLSDWYTFSHIIHGIIFFGALALVAKKLSFQSRLFIATCIEVFWEVIENTPFIINRYRETTISLDYYGDSIINSLFDVLAMILGFFIARKFPIWVSIVLIVLMEIGVGYIIRDNLALNILMLIYPVPAVQNWQMNI